MHPNTYLKAFWRSEYSPQVFVAMSFDPAFDNRYDRIIRPAIEDGPIASESLTAYRVDNSKTGDSILTNIVEGIAHSRLVLADLSVVDTGSSSGATFRNGNVMYEVGLALAARNPAEVLLVRDDNERFLFDVSTIPHLTLDFSDERKAKDQLREALEDRLTESKTVDDARVRIGVESLTQDDLRILRSLEDLKKDQVRSFEIPKLGQPSSPNRRGIERLTSSGCIRAVAINKEVGSFYYELTPFGRAVAERAYDRLPALPDTTEISGEGGT